MQPDLQLDLSGLNCPLPILRAKKALAGLTSGQVLSAIATDPGAPKDFEAFCRQTGNALLESSTTDDGRFLLVIRRK
jgi:tRNA 2-thiouridine synthesizing protein A